MKILLGNFAGAGCNLLKYLSWCDIKKEEDKVLFFYANKLDNDHPTLLPFVPASSRITSKDIYDNKDKNIFYKLFEHSDGSTDEDVYTPDILDMHFPCYFEKARYESFQFKPFPSSYAAYTNNFIFVKELFQDPLLQQHRNHYSELWAKYMKPTPHFTEVLSRESAQLVKLKEEGKRILAVFIRGPHHFISSDSNKSYDFHDILCEIKETMKDYDYLLPLTQVQPYYQCIQNDFEGKVIELKRKRLPEMMDWAQVKYTDKEFEEEVTAAIVDIYLASYCNKLLGGMSNLFISCLLLNPVLEFKVFDCLSGKDGY
jgi:hypothetical protein